MFQNDEEFLSWAKLNRLSEKAISVIRIIRESNPARSVRSGPYNVSGRFAQSRKMNHTIQFESRTVEFPAILLMEMDYLYQEEDVIEIWDQPPFFNINYLNNNKKNIGHRYTADFFIIRKGGAGWEEWKREEALEKECEKNNNKYCKDDEGFWHFPPGEEYALPLGLYFHVHSSDEIDPTLHRNLKLLLPHYNAEIDVSLPVHENVQELVKGNPGITLLELFEEVEGATKVHVFQLLLSQRIFIDLREAWLGDEKSVRLFDCKQVSEFFVLTNTNQNVKNNIIGRAKDIIIGSTVQWDGLTLEVILTGDTEIMLRDERQGIQRFPLKIFEQLIQEKQITNVHFRTVVDKNSQTYKTLQQLGSRAQISVALERFKIISPALQGEEITDKTNTNRTHRNWIAAYKYSEIKTGNGMLGLLPHHEKKGNRTDRLEEQSIGMRQKIVDFIETDYENPICKVKSLAFGQLCLSLEKEGIQPPSLKTVYKIINSRKSVEQTKKMEGEKVAYQDKEFNDWSNGIPVHGDRPWEYAHIDHTPIELEIIHSIENIEMATVWLSLMFGAYDRMPLAHHLSFDPPSYRSNMCLLRECVRRHGRLSGGHIVDNGSEFHGIHFEKFHARYKTDIIWRPPSSPRFGSIIERFFLTANKQFFHNLQGNKKIIKKFRQVTKAVDPKRHAVWDLPTLDLFLDTYLYEEYPNQWHSGLGKTPNQAHAEGLIKFPMPPVEKIIYDDNFLIETMPSTNRGTAQLTRQRGVKFRGVFYKSNKSRRPDFYGKQVEFRYDPFSRAHIYVYIGNEWVECLGPAHIYAELKNKTEREQKIEAEEDKELKKIYGRSYKTRLMEQAANHENREASEKLRRQRLNDEELRKSAQQRGVLLSPGTSHMVAQPSTTHTGTTKAEENITNEDLPPKRVKRKSFGRAFDRNKK